MELAELKDDELMNRSERSAKPSFLGRKYLINPKVQIAYSIAASWMVLVSIGVSALIVYYTIATVIFDPHNQQLPGHKALELANEQIFRALSTAAFFLIAMSVLLTVYFLHRLVGPVYRIEQVLKSAAAGAIPHEIKFRKHDEFQELSQALLEVLNTIGTTQSGAFRAIDAHLSDVPEEDVAVESKGVAAQPPADEGEADVEGEDSAAATEEVEGEADDERRESDSDGEDVSEDETDAKNDDSTDDEKSK